MIFLENEDQLAERTGDREDRYLQAITKARNAAENEGDQKTVTKLVQFYDNIQDKRRHRQAKTVKSDRRSNLGVGEGNRDLWRSN